MSRLTCRTVYVVRTPIRRQFVRLILIPLILVGFVGNVSVAQDALGRGDSLDHSLSTSGRINARKQMPVGTLNNELRGTGVMLGRDFNEGIGRNNDDGLQLIRDAANLGDEDAYLDAINNSPWYWNNWDQQSAQFLLQGDKNYFNPNFTDEWSMAPKQMYKGRSIRTYSHAWSEQTASVQNRAGELEYPVDWSMRQVEQYRLGQVLGSGNAQPPSMDVTPLRVGSFRNFEGVGYLTASPLTGISIESSDKAYRGLGFSSWDAARFEEERNAGLISDSIVVAWRQEDNKLDRRVAETEIVSTQQYNNLLDAIATRTALLTQEEDTSISSLNDAYVTMQNQLAGIPTYDDVDEEEESFGTDEGSETTEVAEEDSLSYLSGILRHGERISQFSGVRDSRFNEIMRDAEQALAKSEYFLAKRRFDQALRFVPGHPFGTAGLGHSNIGAGLYLSASHVLQSLLSLQPEMIDVMYDSQLLPTRLELVRAGVAIQQKLDEKRDGGTYAFLLAYIGHQIGDEEMLTMGLEALHEHQEEGDPFIPLLHSIWGKAVTPIPNQESQPE